jgi:hypothetical protein
MFHDSQYVAGFYSTHRYADATPSYRRNEHSQTYDSRSEPVQGSDRSGTDMLVSYLDDNIQRLMRQGMGRFHPAPWNGAGLPAPLDK